MSAVLQGHLFLVVVFNAIVIVMVLLAAVANQTTDHAGESQQGSRSARVVYVLVMECGLQAAMAALEGGRALEAAVQSPPADYHGRRPADVLAAAVGFLRVHAAAAAMILLTILATTFAAGMQDGTSPGEKLLWVGALFASLASLYATARATRGAGRAIAGLPAATQRRLTTAGGAVSLAAHALFLAIGIPVAMRAPASFFGFYLFLTLLASAAALLGGSYLLRALVSLSGGAALPLSRVRLGLLALAGLAAAAALASGGLVVHTISLNGSCGDRFYYPCQEARRDNAAVAAPYLLIAIVFTALTVTLALLRGTATTWVILPPDEDSLAVARLEGEDGGSFLGKKSNVRLGLKRGNSSSGEGKDDEALLLDDNDDDVSSSLA